MTTTIVSIGSNQNIDTAVPNTLVSGSGPEYTITWNKTLSSDVAVGDLATATDVPDGAYVYLITAISGSNYTLKYCTGAGGDQSPTALCSDAYCTSKPTFTFKRAFSLISDFEVMVEDATPDYWGTTDDVIGECHADSATFDENNLFFNNKQSLSSVTLSVYEDDRHDGAHSAAGTAVVLQPESGGTHNHGIIKINIDNMTVEWLDINLDELDSNVTNKAIVLAGTNNNNIIRNNLIHDKGGNPGGTGPFILHVTGAGSSSDTLTIQNNIIYNIVETGGDNTVAVNTNQWAGTANIYNNTIYNIESDGTGKQARGIIYGGNANNTTNIKNNIVAKMVADGAASNERAYDKTSGSSTENASNNLSDDTTTTAAYKAPGSDSLQDKTLSEIAFVSVSPGSEDLHIADSSVCYEAGVDLGTTNEVNIDINGFDRDAGDVTWDMGAHQASRADTGNPAFLMFLDI